jgi:hypothetical protein
VVAVCGRDAHGLVRVVEEGDVGRGGGVRETQERRSWEQEGERAERGMAFRRGGVDVCVATPTRAGPCREEALDAEEEEGEDGRGDIQGENAPDTGRCGGDGHFGSWILGR